MAGVDIRSEFEGAAASSIDSASLTRSTLATPSGPSAAATSATAPSSTAPNGTAQLEQTPDLWDSILNSVKSKKAVAARNLILLGEPSTGKSTLLSALASASPSGLVSSSIGSAGATSLTAETEASDAVKTAAGNPSKDKGRLGSSTDLGLGYGYFDVGDEKEKDEIVARVGVYTLHSSDPAYTSLLRFALPAPIGTVSAEQASTSMSALATAAASMNKASSGGYPSSNGLFQPKPSIEALRDSLVLIALDWEQPWTFLDQLRNWLEALRELVDSASEGSLSRRSHEAQKWSRTQVALDEMRERLESYIRCYVEPQATVDPSAGTDAEGLGLDAMLPPSAMLLSSIMHGDDSSPLADGTLTENWGVPIVVVCTKADLIPKLESERDFKEEQFDYIQQVLRTVCMKYGAALFFTNHTRPQSFDILRSYLLHRLFTPHHAAAAGGGGGGSGAIPAASSGAQANGISDGKSSTTLGAAGGSAAFHFSYRASTTDRDTLLVPSGWDSWGKIRALRDGFDCKGMARGWEYDCDVERLRRDRGLPRGVKEVEDQLDKEIERDAEDKVRSAVKLYEDIVSDYEARPPPHILASRVKEPDEQEFLGQHHAALQRDPDPRSKFSKQNAQAAPDGTLATGNGASAASPDPTDEGPHRGVGPMAGSGLSLPGIDRLLSEGASSLDDGLSSSLGSGGSASSRPARMPAPSRRDTASGRDGGLGSSSSANAARKDAASLLAGISASASSNADGGGVGGQRSGSSRPTSPAMAAGSTSPNLGDMHDPNNPKQSEVLHTFFQSLLKEKGPSGSSMRMLGRDVRSSRPHRSGAGGGSGTSGNGTPAKHRGESDQAE